MGIRQAATRKLVQWLPAEAQEEMAADVVAWLCRASTPAEREVWVERLAPRLLRRLREGQFGLRLAVYAHLRRLGPRAGRKAETGREPTRPGRAAGGGDLQKARQPECLLIQQAGLAWTPGQLPNGPDGEA